MTKKGRNQLIIVILSTNVNHSYNTLSFKKQHDCIRLNADSQFYQTITSGFCQLISSKSIIHRTKLPVLLEHQSDFISASFVSTPFDTCMLFLNNFIFRDKSPLFCVRTIFLIIITSFLIGKKYRRNSIALVINVTSITGNVNDSDQ